MISGAGGFVSRSRTPLIAHFPFDKETFSRESWKLPYNRKENEVGKGLDDATKNV